MPPRHAVPVTGDSPLKPAPLTVSGLRVGHDGRAILPEIYLKVEAGQLWVVAGPNGAGKSTLMQTLVGLLPPIGGTITMADLNDVAYLPQRLALDPVVPMRAIDLIRLGLDRHWSFLKPWLSRQQHAQVATALAEADCADLAYCAYHTLSEGQKQRVLLARALVGRPLLLLMDEPTSAMDVQATRLTLQRLHRLRQANALAVVVISHHLEEILPLADQVLFLDSGTQAVRTAPPDEMRRDPAFRRAFPQLAAGSETDPS
jgi:ABC-type Mn2+/Zn2+ transport system ATPase subunit